MKTTVQTTTINKVIRPAAVPCNDGRTNNKAAMYCKIEYKDGKLSISGVIGPLRNGDARGGCGQIEMEFEHRNPAHNDKRNKSVFNGKEYDSTVYADTMEFAEGWNKDRWFDFLEIWHVYHLNDMQAACEHQRALGWTYESHGQVVTSSGVRVDPNTGISKIWTKQGECTTCGYSIGSRWLKMEVPQNVIEFLQGLPDADMTPAWV